MSSSGKPITITIVDELNPSMTEGLHYQLITRPSDFTVVGGPEQLPTSQRSTQFINEWDLHLSLCPITTIVGSSNMSSTPSIKFRPSLSADQISHILQVLRTQPADSLNNQCIKALAIFELKARHGIVTPSHVSTGRPSLEQSLGFSAPTDNISIEALVRVYDVTPQVLTQSQLDRVNLHRYTNDLMSPTEEAEYEQLNN